jgi:uncharacterized protein
MNNRPRKLRCLPIIMFGAVLFSVAIASNVRAEDSSPNTMERDALGGENWARFALGVAYLSGEGQPKDVAKALSWFSKSAEQGNWAADLQIGSIYFQGLNGTKDYDEARQRFLKSISESPSSQSANPGLWETLSLSFINRGYAEAYLGAIYEEGDGVPVDYAQARAWLTKAVAFAVPVAENALGRMWYDGQGGPRDRAEARKWFLLAAQHGSAEAQVRVGMMMGHAEGGPRDVAQAISWYRKGAEQNDVFAEIHLGHAFYYGTGVKTDYAEAFRWFMKAADQGSALSAAMVGLAYHDGRGAPRNDIIARKWLLIAAREGIENAQLSIGVMYYEGIGGPVDKAEGRRWLKLAANAGNADARAYLRANR